MLKNSNLLGMVLAPLAPGPIFFRVGPPGSFQASSLTKDLGYSRMKKTERKK